MDGNLTARTGLLCERCGSVVMRVTYMWDTTTYGYDGANDKRVVMSKDDVVGALEAHIEFGAAIFLCVLQCTTSKHEASR